MFTQEEYFWAWAFYLCGAFIFLSVLWFFSGKITRLEPKYLIRVVPAVFLLVPWYSEGDSGYLSPAWLISGIEGAFEGSEAFWRAGTPLIVALLSALICTFLIFVVVWIRRYRSNDN